jgi:hypothetical protein
VWLGHEVSYYNGNETGYILGHTQLKNACFGYVKKKHGLLSSEYLKEEAT